VIPLYKLEKLPRTQKLRKIAKVFIAAENRLCMAGADKAAAAGIFTPAEFVFFAEASKLLAADVLFPDNARKSFEEAASVFQTDELSAVLSPLQIRRALNSVKHLLLTATGRDQADWDFTSGDGRLDPAGRRVFEGMFVYMEDIRSPFNVGAMFRTAESFGVEKIFLSQFCADPRHRRSQRTAMGCVDIVPWERHDFFAAEDIPELPYPVFALETGGIPIDEFPFPRRGLLIAGSEELGVSPRALAAADASGGRVSIPIYGAKASLNVSVAFGIAMQAWARVNVSARS
jgi:TrmH family RNA methyltransferase